MAKNQGGTKNPQNQTTGTNNEPQKGTEGKNTPSAQPPQKPDPGSDVETDHEWEKRKAEIEKENAALKTKRKAKQKKAEYTPAPRTGKMYHLLIESPVFDKDTGEKISNSKVLILDFKEAVRWIKDAVRLRFAFRILHDPSKFYTHAQAKQVADAVEFYEKNAHDKLVKFSKKIKLEQSK